MTFTGGICFLSGVWSIFGLFVLLSALVVDYKRGGEDRPLILFAVSL